MKDNNTIIENIKDALKDQICLAEFILIESELDKLKQPSTNVSEVDAEQFIEENYHLDIRLSRYKLIRDSDNEMVTYEEIAEDYHNFKSQQNTNKEVDNERHVLECFCGWMIDNNNTERPYDIFSYMEEYLKTTKK